jgi:aspartate carbamoyltransferase catalytic subunit
MPKVVDALGAVYEEDPVAAVSDADIVYLLRIQRERQDEGLFPSLDEYHQLFGADKSLLEHARPDAMVMHPGPINRGVEISSEVADGTQSMILGQVRSGVAVRMALLYVCLGGVKQ